MSQASNTSQAASATAPYFPSIERIKYDPAAPPSETLVFRQYNASEVIHGKPMSEWLRFSVCAWHTIRGKGLDMFGGATIRRAWDDESNTIENAKRRLEALFEILSKLGIQFWTFHDRDIAPEGRDLAETNANLDIMTDFALELQKKHGIKLLWGTANLFSNPRYKDGAATNPDAHVFAYAAAQVKKALEVTKKLGGENYVFWGGREGFNSLLNTNVRRELDHMAAFFRMAVAHAKKIGFTGQFLIEPKPKEPTKHQYDYDSATVIGFLKTYGLEKDFKLNIEPNHTTLAGHAFEHDIAFAAEYGFLGSIDSNTGQTDLGWDTDNFPMSLPDCAKVMKVVVEQGGLAPGGLNFDAKVRRESTDPADIFIAHIGAMDVFALALRRMIALHEGKTLASMVSARYSTFDSGIGKKIEAGESSFEELEAEILKKPAEAQEPAVISGQQEKYESIFNNYLHAAK